MLTLFKALVLLRLDGSIPAMVSLQNICQINQIEIATSCQIDEAERIKGIKGIKGMPCKDFWDYIKKLLSYHYTINPNNFCSAYFGLNLFITMGNIVLDSTRP